MDKRTKLFTIILAGLLLCPFFLSARAQSEDIIVPDPAVYTGELPNGLRYFVRANPKPAGRAELRLAVRAGSMQEDEDQLGLAHFTEHMLFNGTEKYPRNELIDVLQSLGMDGPDINAYTSFDATVYNLFVRTDEWDQFMLGLDVLDEWASSAALTDEEFEKERSVVYEEYRRGRGAQARIFDRSLPVLFKDSRYARRLPIGSPDIIQNAPADALKRYYRDWYRPDLMAVIAVGDFDPQQVVNAIRMAFSDMEAPQIIRPRETYPVPSHMETLVSVMDDPEATRTTVEIYSKFKPNISKFLPDISRDLAEELYLMMMNERFREMVRQAAPPFIYAGAFTDTLVETASLNGLHATVNEEAPLEGLRVLLTEAERVQRHGFTETELQRAKANLASSFRNYWRDRENLESSDFVQQLVDAFLQDYPYPSIDWQWKAVEKILPQITSADVNKLLEERLTDSDRVILVSGPSVPSVTDITDDDVLMVLDEVETSVIDAWTDESVDGPLVENPPQPGEVVEESRIESADAWVWTLSNGAAVILKPTDFKDDEILFHSWSSGGTSLAADESFMSALLATEAVSQSGLAGFSADELRKNLAGRNISLSPYLGTYSQGFAGSATPEDLETFLELHYASLTVPGKDPVAWESFLSRTAEALKNRAMSPQVQYEDAMRAMLLDDHPRTAAVDSENIYESDLDEAFEFYRNRFGNASGFTYVIVGAFTLEEMKPLVERWLASLPAADENDGWMDRGIRYTTESSRTVVEAGLEPLSVVSQIWTGSWDGTWEEMYRIRSVSQALEMKLTRSIREDASGTYSIGVYPSADIVPDNSYQILVRYTCAPERVDELTDAVKKEVESLAGEPQDQDYASDITESQSRSFDENLMRNYWWMDQLTFSIERNIPMQQLLDKTSLDTLSNDILMQSAEMYFLGGNYNEVILMPESNK